MTEAEEAQKKKQAAVDAAPASISNAPAADAALAAGAKSSHSTTKLRGVLVLASGWLHGAKLQAPHMLLLATTHAPLQLSIQVLLFLPFCVYVLHSHITFTHTVTATT